MLTSHLSTLNSTTSCNMSPNEVTQHISTLSAAESADHGIVAGLNNAGVNFLSLHREDLASDLFRFALQFATGRLGLEEAIQVFQRASSWHQQVVERNHERCGERPTDPSAVTSFMSTHSLINHETSPDSPSITSLPFVHTEGLLFMPSSEIFSTDVLLRTTVTSSILIFNMGLAYHLQALHGKSIDLKRLAIARSLYLKGIRLLRDANIFTDVSIGGEHPILDLLILALCNNLGQTSYEVGAYAEARHYFGSMLQYAATVDNSAKYASDSLAATMIHLHKSSFLLNAMILHPPTVAPIA